MNNKWQIALTIIFPGLGQIIQGRWKIGIPMVIFNGLFLYVLWFVLMPVSLGIILHDLRVANGSLSKFEAEYPAKEKRSKSQFPTRVVDESGSSRNI